MTTWKSLLSIVEKKLFVVVFFIKTIKYKANKTCVYFAFSLINLKKFLASAKRLSFI